MTEREYNEAEGIRRSDLWIMKDSPEKFKWHMDHPEEDEAKSPAFLFGSVCHKMVLEPESFDDECAVMPDIDRRTKAGKEEWAAFCEENEGKTVISMDDFQTIAEMSKVVVNHQLAGRMLSGQHEVPFFWTDPETGEKCKCKADVVRKEDGRYVIVDYKTTTDASTETFNKHIFKYGYHVQAAMYSEGLQIALGLDYRPSFAFVAQEKKAPYAVNVIDVSEDVMNYGSTVYHELLQRYHNCKEVDIWPGYVEDVANDAFVPTWMELEMEDFE